MLSQRDLSLNLENNSLGLRLNSNKQDVSPVLERITLLITARTSELCVSRIAVFKCIGNIGASRDLILLLACSFDL